MVTFNKGFINCIHGGVAMRLSRYAVFPFLLMLLLLGSCVKQPAPSRSGFGTAMSADGVPIRYVSTGSGDLALVFVHCWTCNSAFWNAQIGHFAGRYQVVTLDLAGHGESGKGRKDYTIDAFGADVVAVADKLNLKRIVLVGHSMGGPVAVQAQKYLGGRVVGIVGVDTFHTSFQIPKGEQGKQLLLDFIKPLDDNFTEYRGKFMASLFAPGADPALVERVEKSAASSDKELAISAMKGIFAWYATEADAGLERVGDRLRNINGDPKGENKSLHDSVVLMAGAGHFPAQEKPAEFNQALDRILMQLEGLDR